MQVVIRGKDDVPNTGRLPDLRSAAQGLRLIDMPGPMRPPPPPASKANLSVQFPMQLGDPLRTPVPGQGPLASLVRGQSPKFSTCWQLAASICKPACLLKQTLPVIYYILLLRWPPLPFRQYLAQAICKHSKAEWAPKTHYLPRVYKPTLTLIGPCRIGTHKLVQQEALLLVYP